MLLVYWILDDEATLSFGTPPKDEIALIHSGRSDDCVGPLALLDRVRPANRKE